MGIAGDRDHIGNAGHNPAEPVGPAGEVSGHGAQQVCGEVDKGFVLEVGQQQLAHGTHHEKQHKADDHVDEDDRGTGEADGLARAHEQTGTDGTANGDQLDMAIGQAALQLRFLGIRSVILHESSSLLFLYGVPGPDKHHVYPERTKGHEHVLCQHRTRGQAGRLCAVESVCV